MGRCGIHNEAAELLKERLSTKVSIDKDTARRLFTADARKHGVEVRPVCINRSRWDCTLEPIDGTDGHAVRLGMRLVRGLATADAARIVAARADEHFASVDDMWRRSGVPVASLVEPAEADAFLSSLRLERRDALWAIRALRDEPLPLFTAAAEREARAIAEQQEPEVELDITVPPA
ncbi:error-prone DNA polymerase [Rhizobium mongolense]|uniref:Error-prone DNA polymerase n=1 Tax=Rhizobium mongolense TaxID=57676 RepID=A0ABR6J037_9HYPH|nr:error-prone DNA polymerase [Rhizobium mongolense]